VWAREGGSDAAKYNEIEADSHLLEGWLLVFEVVFDVLDAHWDVMMVDG
jgi:hypothetical protein